MKKNIYEGKTYEEFYAQFLKDKEYIKDFKY